VSVPFFVRFEPRPGRTDFRAELLRVVDSTRAEMGCWLSMYLSRSGSRSCSRFIRSGWMRLRLSCTRNCRIPFGFLELGRRCLTHPVQGLRSREIGGAGAARLPDSQTP
jgi:hypothetical protein